MSAGWEIAIFVVRGWGQLAIKLLLKLVTLHTTLTLNWIVMIVVYIELLVHVLQPILVKLLLPLEEDVLNIFNNIGNPQYSTIQRCAPKGKIGINFEFNSLKIVLIEGNIHFQRENIYGMKGLVGKLMCRKFWETPNWHSEWCIFIYLFVVV